MQTAPLDKQYLFLPDRIADLRNEYREQSRKSGSALILFCRFSVNTAAIWNSISYILNKKLGAAENCLFPRTALRAPPFIFHDVIKTVTFVAHALSLYLINDQFGTPENRFFICNNKIKLVIWICSSYQHLRKHFHRAVLLFHYRMSSSGKYLFFPCSPIIFSIHIMLYQRPNL